jgi:glycerophosphoryl diester phosphodiesterase
MGRDDGDVQVIAHRGASGYLAEHTFAAYDLALAQGADALEVDVRATADGELVLVHDETLQRTVGDDRRVDELTAAEIAALDHDARPVALDAALARYGDATAYLVDLKDPTPAWEDRVVEALDRHGLRHRATFQSFDLDALARLHAADATLPITALYRRADSLELDVDAVPPFAAAFSPCHVAVDAELVGRARARGPGVTPWTVDTPDDAGRLLALGVDALITNRPDVVRGVAPRTEEHEPGSRGRIAG